MPDTSAVITCSPHSEGIAALEVRSAWPEAGLEWLDDGVARISAGVSFAPFVEKLETSGSVFIRHLAPADLTLAAEPSAILDAVRTAATHIEPGEAFTVQVRRFGEDALGDQFAALAETAAVSASQGRLDRRNPSAVVSVTLAGGRAYVGCAKVSLCRSSWPGGERRYHRDADRISRAEFKLLEAMETFRLELPSEGRALDLGAAPGGWTHLLLERGLTVTAVDPAPIDRRVLGNPRLNALRMTAESFLAAAPVFDVIVSDLRMDARRATLILLQCADQMQAAGVVVATLKLPERGVRSIDVLRLVRATLVRLTGRYADVRARQLFHNRSEITLALRRPFQSGASDA